ncbi:MAG: diaminopimelate dehydrogenase [Oscillospiraceae bacterium]|jgi:diaminopimelate dehydrogenase|nr:diaminopimelate dehydrogenase [Oscillospiraceae bacterium]
MKLRIGIAGYGNVGRGAAMAVAANADMELVAIFTRRDPKSLKIDNNAAVLPIDSAEAMVGKIDVLLLCGGSATDLPEQGPQLAAMFNTVDSYDNHAKIPEYMASIDSVAKNTTAIVSAGWDPGLFSMMRAQYEAVVPTGSTYTFWGKGVSQGHSDAIRRVKGVKNAVQYTIPVDDAICAVRSGVMPTLKPREKISRDCYVVLEPDANKDDVEKVIKTMPNYFADYNTTVTFIDEDELIAKHSNMPHGGMVIRSGQSGESGQNNHVLEFSLKLDSNPEFTGSIMAVYARAAYRMSREGLYGAKTVFDVPFSYISVKDRFTLIKELL